MDAGLSKPVAWPAQMTPQKEDSLLSKILKCNAPAVAHHDDTHSQHEHPGGATSLMARSFRCHALLCRLCGCFFIRDLFRKDGKRSPRVVWRSWYTLYSLCCIGFLLWMQVGVVAHASHQATRTGHSFQGSLSVVAHTVLFVKIIVNAISVVAGTSKMLEFYLRAAVFEKRVGIRACHCCAPKKYFWSDVRRYCVFVAYCVAFAAAVPLVPEWHALSSVRTHNVWSRVSLWIKILVLIILYFVYDSVHVVALRSAGKVIVEYLKNQLTVLEECMAAQVTGAQTLSHRAGDARCLVEAIRFHFYEIQELKTAVNEVWSWSLVVSSTCTLLVLCTSLYEVCQNGPAKWESYTVFMYSTYITYDFVTLASTSQSMADMGKKIKDACKTTSGLKDDYYRHQIEYLHSCIEPEELSLAGGDFFKLNMSLLVSMAAAIITYTVILVQTSQTVTDILQQNSTCLGNTNATT